MEELKDTTPQLVEKIKAYRVKLDEMGNSLEKRSWHIDARFLFKTIYHASDFDICAKKVRYWLGKELAALGETSPYNVVRDVSKIPPVADTSNENSYEGLNNLDLVNKLREELQEMIDEVDKIDWSKPYRKHFLLEQLGYMKMHLGYILGQIRENAIFQKEHQERLNNL